MKIREKLALIVIMLLILFQVYQCQSHKKALSQQVNQSLALAEDKDRTINQFRNKKNELLTEVEALKLNEAKMLEQKTELRDLLGKAKGKINTVIQIEEKIRYVNSQPTEIIIPTRPISINDSLTDGLSEVIDSVTFKSDYKDLWVDYSIIANSDSINLDVGFTNDLAIIHFERKSLFKPTEYRILTKQKNPYVRGSTTKSYVIKPNKFKRFHIGPYLGIGLDAKGNFVPNLGIGAVFSLISL